MTSVQVANQSVPAARRARQLCDHCGGPFGLVTHRWWGSKFCTRRCKDGHIRKIMADLRTWASTRKGVAMLPRSAWNCSRGLRTVTHALLVLSFSGLFSDSEAWSCGKSFEVQAARFRSTNARQSGASPEDPDQVCRAYRTQFYEAVEARQTVSQCEAGVERQKGIEILDAEIDAFNNLIATRCGLESPH
jgi:hypothetical protein